MSGSTKVELTPLELAIARDLASEKGVSVEVVVGQLLRTEAAAAWLQREAETGTAAGSQDGTETAADAA